MRSHCVALLALLSLAGVSCSAPTESLGADTLTGTWLHPFDLPGFSDVLVLEVHDGVVTGTGTWAGEAGPSGTSAVAGTATGDQVRIDITRTQRQPQPGAPRTDHFEGRIVSSSQVTGTLVQGDVGVPYVYLRVQIVAN
jgi:hypothetical protein